MTPTRGASEGNARTEASGAQRADLVPGVGEVQVQRDGIAVHEDRVRAQVAHDLRRRGERHGRHEDSVARPQPERLDGQVQRGRRGVERHRVPRPDGVAELLLEALHARARRQPPGFQDRQHLVDLGLADRGTEERHLDCHRSPFTNTPT
jgi:hypothetical protein